MFKEVEKKMSRELKESLTTMFSLNAKRHGIVHSVYTLYSKTEWK